MTNVDWNQAASQREQLLFALIAVVGMFFFFYSVSVPRVAAVRDLRTQEAALSMERDALVKFVEKTPTVPQLFSEERPKDTKLKVLLGEIKSPFVDLASLLPKITDPSFLNGIQIKGLSFQADVPESGYVRTDFVIETSGAFREVMGYLQRLEEFPALFLVRDIVLSAYEGNRAEVQAEISCRFFKQGGKETGP